MKRRHSLKLLSTLPLLAAFPTQVWAEHHEKKKDAKAGAMPMLDESEPLAKGLQYRADASKAPAMRTNKKSFCHNCAKYNVCMDGDSSCKPLSAAELKTAKAAPCQLFKGKAVAKEGWCLSWTAKS